MLATLIIWGYSLVLFYIYGYSGLALLKKIFHFQDNNLSFPIVTIVGFAILTTLVSFLSLFISLGALAAFLVLMGGAFLAFLTRPWKDFSFSTRHPLVITLLIVVIIITLANAIQRPTNYDTALYHAQAIHWIENYRVVPGLVNIHDRLAYNSSWLVLVASLSFAFLGLRSFHLTNSILLLVTTTYFAEGFQELIKKRFTVSNIAKALFFFLPLYLYASDLSSPGTDLPPTLLIWAITALTLEKLESQGLDFDLHAMAIFTLSVFVVTVKLSALPICGLALLVLVIQIWRKNVQQSLILLSVAFLILLPWFLRSIIQSGYLIYPISQIDLFSFDWKYPMDAARSAQTELLWFNRFPFNEKEYIGMPISQWVPLWFHQLERSQKILVLVAVISPILFFWSILNTTTENLKRGYGIIFLINYVGVYFWIFTAPIFRFGYSYLLASIVLAVAPLIAKLLSAAAIKFAGAAIAFTVISLLFQIYILAATTNVSSIRQHIFLPADYFPSTTQPCPINNAAVYCGQELGLCNYEPFPCMPKPRHDVEMRGTTLQDGFRTIQNP